MNPVTLPEEDAQMIKDAQKNAIMRDPTMAAATLAGAQAEAMKAAASNQAGAMTGFMGMGMASQAGGANMQSLYQMGAQQQAQAAPKMQHHPVWEHGNANVELRIPESSAQSAENQDHKKRDCIRSYYQGTVVYSTRGKPMSD